MSTTTSNMGLTAWNNANDFFNFSELLANWQAVDEHDHTTGKGAQIIAGGLAANAVTATNIAANAVTTAKILDDNVTAGKLGPASVDTTALGAIASVHANRTTPLSVANNTPTALTYNLETWDTGTFHDNSSNPSRLTAPVAGKYLVSASTVFAVDADGYRTSNIYINGAATELIHTQPANATVAAAVNVAGIVNLAATDYVENYVTHTSGAALDVSGAFQAVLVSA